MTVPTVCVGRGDDSAAAAALYDAWSTLGYCYVSGADEYVPRAVVTAMHGALEAFGALPDDVKRSVHVSKGGVAWRGFVAYGDEGTRGTPDFKEGLYLGADLPDDHPGVVAGLPLHGRNLLPDAHVPQLRAAIADYVEAVTALGQRLMTLTSLALGLPADYMRREYTREPLAIVRAFAYPPSRAASDGQSRFGIGDHTDFGLLTINWQSAPGLQVYDERDAAAAGWIDVPPRDGAFVCSVGDMLDRMSDGRLISARHRVINAGDTTRLAVPFFFDFSWDAHMRALPIDESSAPPRLVMSDAARAAAATRWSKTKFTGIDGQWSQYLARKVLKVFPDLKLELHAHGAASAPSTRHGVVITTAAPVAAKQGSGAHINVEVKARVRGAEHLAHIRAAIDRHATERRGVDHQTDTYFNAAHGRLKVRQGDKENALIHYARADTGGARESAVTLHALASRAAGDSLVACLAAAHGVLVVVEKRREIVFCDGNVKVHVDAVRGLRDAAGDRHFVEIEAIERGGAAARCASDDDERAHLRAQCEHFMRLFALTDADLVHVSYSDLLLEQQHAERLRGATSPP